MITLLLVWQLHSIVAGTPWFRDFAGREVAGFEQMTGKQEKGGRR